MPYTDDRPAKFNEMLGRALDEIRKEASYLDDMSEASLSEDTLQEQVRASETEVWKNLEVGLTRYDLLEKMLKERESQLAQKTGPPEQNVNAPLTDSPPQIDATVESLKSDLERQKTDIDQSLLQDLKGRLRVTINLKLTPNYATTLSMFKPEGLAEVLNPEQMVDTDAKSSLLYMLNTMPGGSIGIAGSRGSGKSTLIQMCCGRKRKLHDINGTKVLAVLTSAPVQYDSRDFILYLFSALCQKVLDPDDTADVLAAVPEIDTLPSPRREMPTLDWFLRRAPGVLYKLGGVVIVVSLLAAIAVSLLATFSSSIGQTQPSTQSTQATARDPVSTQAPATVPSAPIGRTRAFIDNLIKLSAIKPEAGLAWGIFLWLSAFSLTLLSRAYIENRRFPQSYEEYERASEYTRLAWQDRANFLRWKYRGRIFDDGGSGGPVKKLLSSIRSLALGMRRWFAERFRRDDLEFSYRMDDYRLRLEQESSLVTLQDHAKRWLKEIRFQQSFTAGWSGALKLPVGLEGGVNSAVTLAQRQMSNPEIVAAYIRFVDKVSQEYKLIVGIDELDKMETDDDAQKFLNEIKSIFGLPNCFYLISVSENAMSSFERRGLPFRDVFDSSFDNVVYVDYLNHKTAKTLLEKRIIGKPYPFIYLSYCFSGGLPRDLIRNFRNLLEFNQSSTNGKAVGKTLTTLCHEVITADLKAKIRATAASAKKIDADLVGSSLVERLFQISTTTVSDASLFAEANALLQWQWARSPDTKPVEEIAAEAVRIRKVECLSKELGSYLYLLATVLGFFNDSLDEPTLKNAARNGDLETLATARQFMEVNPSITVSLLNNLRKKWGKATLPLESSVKSQPAKDIETLGASQPSA